MPSSKRLSSTANATFSISSGLMVVGFALLGAILYSGKYDYTTIKDNVDHKYRREDVKQFLYFNVGWNQQPAFLTLNPPITVEDDLPQMYRDLHGFSSQLLTLHKAVLDCLNNLSFNYVDREAKLKGTSVSDLNVDIGEENTRLRNGLVEAEWALQYMVTIILNQGGPPKDAEHCSLRVIQGYGSLTNEHIVTLMNAYDEMAAQPETWMVDPSLVPDLANLSKDNPREKTDLRYLWFERVLLDDPYSQALSSSTPSDFEVSYGKEEAAYKEAMNFETGPSIKTFDLLPELPLGLCLRSYPWIIVAGAFLSFHLIRRFRHFIVTTKTSDLEDPGFPMNLILFQPSRGEGRLISTSITTMLVFAPALIASANYYTRSDLADQLTSLADTMSQQLKTLDQDDGFTQALDNLKSSISQIDPNGLELCGVLLAFTLSFIVLVQLEKSKTLVTTQESRGMPSSQPDTGGPVQS